MLARTFSVISQNPDMRAQWMKLVGAKLVPLKLLMLAGQGVHEWSGTYREMIFEMALFMDRYRGEVTPELIRQFINRQPRNNIFASFSEPEIGLLMRKSVEYNLRLPFSPANAIVRASWRRPSA